MSPYKVCIRRGGPIALLVALGIAGSGIGQQNEQPTENSASPDGKFPRPVLSTHDLMENFNQPIYRSLRDLLSQPADQFQRWSRVERQAYRAAEVANLIALRPAARAFPDWTERASDVQDAAVKLAEAAKQKDFHATRRAYADLVQSCNDCHQATRPGHAPNLKPFGGQEDARKQDGANQPTEAVD